MNLLNSKRNRTDSSLRVALIGCGKMGTAMATAWISAGLISHLDILDPFAVCFSSAPSLVSFCHHAEKTSFLEPMGLSDIVIFAVKPQQMEEVCASLGPSIPRTATVLSIAAGRTLKSLSPHFPQGPALIRAMPNTPASIGKGMTVAIAGPHTPQTSKVSVSKFLECLGSLLWVEDETLMDAVTALSGSGPAYLFYLIEIMEQAAIEQRIPPEMASILARKTIIGSAALAERFPEQTPEDLRRSVTSPKGTTEAALGVLMNGEWRDLFFRAVKKAADRSRELSA